MSGPAQLLLGSSASVLTSFTDHAAQTADVSIYTFTAKAIGTAATNRKVVVCTTTAGGSAGTDGVSSMTIGGVSATKAIETNGSGDHCTSSIWYAAVPTGTTGDIVVTWASTRARCGIGVWALYGAAVAPANTATSTASPPSSSITIPSGGVCIGVAVATSGTEQPTWTWTNATKRYDENQGGPNNSTNTGADNSTSGTPTITATPSSTVNRSMALAAWAPL